MNSVHSCRQRRMEYNMISYTINIVLFSSHFVIYLKLRKIFNYFDISNNMEIHCIMHTIVLMHFFRNNCRKLLIYLYADIVCNRGITICLSHH